MPAPSDARIESTTSSAEERERRLSTFALLACFLLSRVLHRFAGVEFDDSYLRISWQTIAPELLRERLLESLWYQHSQPPLFNLFVGIVQKLLPETPTDILEPLWTLLGLLNLLATDALLRGFDVRPGTRWGVLLLLSFNPSYVLIENWCFYTHPLMCATTFAAWAWMRAVRARDLRFVALVAALLAGMALTRSLFHLAWYVVLAATLVGFMPGRRRATAAIVLLPGLAVLALYLKNLFVFGFFGASSWLGMSLAKNTTFQLSEQERSALVAEGVLSTTATIRPFERPARYPGVVEAKKTGIPVLDVLRTESGAANMNHAAFLGISADYRRDALWTLRNRPLDCLKSQYDSWLNYCQSTSLYNALGENRRRIEAWDRFFSGFVYVQIEGPPRRKRPAGTYWSFYLPRKGRPFSLAVVAMTLVVLFAVPFEAARRWKAGTRAAPSGTPTGAREAIPDEAEASAARNRAAAATLVFVWLDVLYVACVGNLLETGENNRFRFMTESLCWIAMALFVERTVSRFRRRS